MTQTTVTPQEEAFAVAMADPTCRGITDAYVRAGYSLNSSPTTRNKQAYEISQRPHVAARIAVLRGIAAAPILDSATAVLADWVAIAAADPAELSHVRVFNCRHCYGAAHGYQWIDDGEYVRACASVIDFNAHRKESLPERALPDYSGGVGFMRNRAPCEDCPHCWGDGERHEFFADTTRLSRHARRLFAGVKRTRDGIEIKTRDQDAALLNIAKYLGMIVDRHRLGGDPANPTPIPIAAAVAALDPQDAARLYQEFIAGRA